MKNPSSAELDRFRSLGVTFEPHFTNGAVGLLARYDIPLLYYPHTMSLAEVQDRIEKANNVLARVFRGHGHYSHCPNSESQSSGGHVLVLMCDAEFYEHYQQLSSEAFG